MTEQTKKLVRIAGKLKELVVIKDDKGNVLHKILNPVMVEFYSRDMMQIIVGAALLAIPIAFTEEVWNLGLTLPLGNVLLISLLSLIFISSFVYYNFYRNRMKGQLFQFFKRVSAIYLGSFVVVALFLTLINRAPWQLDLLLAVKRCILVAFPASMSAAVSDMIK